MRKACDNPKCSVTIEDIEQVNVKRFIKCRKCKKLATACWQFVTACIGQERAELLILTLMHHYK
jgi:hypothetical protein